MVCDLKGRQEKLESTNQSDCAGVPCRNQHREEGCRTKGSILP